MRVKRWSSCKLLKTRADPFQVKQPVRYLGLVNLGWRIGRDDRSTAAGAAALLRYASRMANESCSMLQAIWSLVMTAGGARRMWSPEIPSTLPCMG